MCLFAPQQGSGGRGGIQYTTSREEDLGLNHQGAGSMTGTGNPNYRTTLLSREGIELPVSMVGDPQVQGPVGFLSPPTERIKRVMRVENGLTEVEKVGERAPRGVRTSRMAHSSTSSVQEPMDVAVDVGAEARTALERMPRPAVVVISAFSELFSAEYAWMVSAADGLMIDVDDPFTKAHPTEVQRWIDVAYHLGKQVFAAGTPDGLAHAVAIRSRNVTTIQKSGSFASLRGQELANEVSMRLEKMFARIPGQKPPASRTATEEAPQEHWAVSPVKRNLSPAYYQQAISVEEEKELDRVLDENDR
jgi:hypothetical protein